jgi:hypothetical protein
VWGNTVCRKKTLTRAAGGESSWDTDDEAFARGEFLSKIDLVSRRAFDERDGWD